MDAGSLQHTQSTERDQGPASVINDLVIRGLCKSFNDTKVLENVDFEILRGEAVALIGANGTGKSTLLRCCLRLVEPDRGDIRILNSDVASMNQRNLRSMRSKIGFVFQRHNLVPRLSVLTNILQGAQARKNGPRVWYHWLADHKDREEAMQCLDMVGLSHLAKQRVDRLSGGQSQRVAIARTLMQRPKIVMADEPVASLDPNAGEEVMSLFVNLMRKEGVTLYYTSHNLEHALEYSDRVLGLRNRNIELNAPSGTLKASNLREIYA